MLAEAGMAAVRAKGVALTEFAVELFDAWLAPKGSRWPRRGTRPAGSHVLFRHPGGAALYAKLLERGVIPTTGSPRGSGWGSPPHHALRRRRRRGERSPSWPPDRRLGDRQ